VGNLFIDVPGNLCTYLCCSAKKIQLTLTYFEELLSRGVLNRDTELKNKTKTTIIFLLASIKLQFVEVYLNIS